MLKRLQHLKNYPFDERIEANPNKIAQNYLLHDNNYNVVGAINNPDSFKEIYLVAGESYSRVLTFTSVTSYSVGGVKDFLALNITSSTDLQAGDRIFIKKR